MSFPFFFDVRVNVSPFITSGLKADTKSKSNLIKVNSLFFLCDMLLLYMEVQKCLKK